MLDLLNTYLKTVEKAISELEEVIIVRYEEEILADDRANQMIRIRFTKGHLLEINEAIICTKNEIKHLNYRYHCQDKQNHLIFRYDNAPHFSDLMTFPHHKHFPDKVENSEQPAIIDVLNEAINMNKNEQESSRY